jgi:hypothetical protein
MQLIVFIRSGGLVCSERGEALGRHDWIMLVGEKGGLCLYYVDPDQLFFLPSAGGVLTRRAGK